MSVLWPDGLPLALELPMIVTDLRPLNAGGLHVRIAAQRSERALRPIVGNATTRRQPNGKIIEDSIYKKQYWYDIKSSVYVDLTMLQCRQCIANSTQTLRNIYCPHSSLRHCDSIPRIGKLAW